MPRITLMNMPKQLRHGRAAFSLAEMIVAVAVLSTIGLSMGLLFSAGLSVHEAAADQDHMCRAANMALLRMKTFGRESNRLFVPNVKAPSGQSLAFASMIDDDGDGLYNEDPPGYVDGPKSSGIKGLDDDGDGVVDEGAAGDDDEDGKVDEDPINGIDDDGDGAVDEDAGADIDQVKGATAQPDDDGDGKANEDPYQPIVYRWDKAKKELYERHPIYGENLVAKDVTDFNVTLTQGASGQCLVSVSIRIEVENGKYVDAGISFYMRNAAYIGNLNAPVDPGAGANTLVDAPDPEDAPEDPGDALSDDDGDRPTNPFRSILSRLAHRRGRGGRRGDGDKDDDGKTSGEGRGGRGDHGGWRGRRR